MVKLSAPFVEFIESIARAGAPLAEMMRRIGEELEKCKRLETAGWLPHAEMPFKDISDSALDSKAISEIVERHYRESWPAIKAGFLESVAACDLDDEAQATFAEALEAHDTNLFRLTSRALFPEIERLSRLAIHDGAMDRIASQPMLREAAGSLTPGEMAVAGSHGLTLYSRLRDHLYANLTTEEDLAKILASPIPNRHAAVHGFSTYGTFKGSLNALILTEFIFRTISALKQRARDQSELAAA